MRLIDADTLRDNLLQIHDDIRKKKKSRLISEPDTLVVAHLLVLDEYVKKLDETPTVTHHYNCNHDCDALYNAYNKGYLKGKEDALKEEQQMKDYCDNDYDATINFLKEYLQENQKTEGATMEAKRRLHLENIVRHFKGGLYKILEFSTHTETNEKLVTYQSLTDHRVWTRPYDMFMSKVDKEKYPNATQEYRMELVRVVTKKILPEYFQLIVDNLKSFEIHKDEDNFQAGDLLRLREWDDKTQTYTGRGVTVEITYVLRNASQYGLSEGYCILNLGNKYLYSKQTYQYIQELR